MAEERREPVSDQAVGDDLVPVGVRPELRFRGVDMEQPEPVEPARPFAPDQPPPPPPPNRTVPYIVGGVGAASLIAGGVFFALRQTTLATLEEQCPDRLRCDRRNMPAYERVKLFSVVAPVATGSIMGFGKHGYDLAVQAVAAALER